MKKIYLLVIFMIIFSLAIIPMQTDSVFATEASNTDTSITNYPIYLEKSNDGKAGTVLIDVYGSGTLKTKDKNSTLADAGQLVVTCTNVAGRMYCNWNINLAPGYQISWVNLNMAFQKSQLLTWNTLATVPINKKGYGTNFQGDQETFYIASYGSGYYRVRVTGSITLIVQGVAYMTPKNSNTVQYE